MLKPTLLLVAAMLAAAPLSATPAGPVPPALKKLAPVQVVERVLAQQEVLALSTAQVAHLDNLATRIRSERHAWVRVAGKQAPMRHVPMVTRTEAYTQALAILTPEQQARFTGFYPVAAAPRQDPPRRHRAPGKA